MPPATPPGRCALARFARYALLALASAGAAGADPGATAPAPAPSPGERALEKEGFHRFRDPIVTYQVADLQHQIDLLNLLNGLYLSDDQALRVMALADQAARARAGSRAAVAEANRALEEALRRMRDTLAARGFAAGAYGDTAFKDGAHDYERAAGRLGETATRLERDLADLEADLRSVLTANQVEIVLAYKSCLIPNRDMKDPTRIGQANENAARYLEALAAARAAAPAALTDAKARLWAVYRGYYEYHKLRFTPEGERQQEAKVSAVVDRARKLSAVDWALTKNDLAKEIEDLPLPAPPAKSDKAKRPDPAKDRGPAPQLTRVGRMLLDPVVPQLLAERLRASRTFKKGDAVDLGDLEAAPTCTSGHCALDE